MKRIVRLNESDMSRIVRKVINEEGVAEIPECNSVKVTQGSYEGEKDGFAILRYDVDKQNKVVPVGSGGNPRRCKFNRRTIISLQGRM